MVDNDVVLKMMLEGVMVSEKEVTKLTIPLLAVFLKYKGVSLKQIDSNRKAALVTMAMEAMGAVLPAAAPVLPAVMPVQKAKEGSDEELIELIDAAAIGVASDQVMGVHHEAGIVGDDLETQINAALGLDGEQSVDMRRVGANVGPEVEVEMSAARHQEPILGVAVVPVTNPPAELNQPFSALEAVLRERDSAPIKEVPAIFVEGTYLEGIVAEFRALLDESLGIMLSAKGSNTTKKFQIEGPMRKLKLALARMESAFASIESSDVSGDESDAKSLTSVSPVSAAVTLKPVAKFRLDLPPATIKPEKWSASIPEVTATIARLAAGGDQQLKDKEGSVVNPPPTVPQATFSSSFATTGISARFVQWDHDAIDAAGVRAQGSEGAFSKVEHSTTLPAAVQGQEGTIGVTNQDQGAVKMTGEIIKLFHWDRYGFIRSERSGDFFIGSAQYWPMMKIGDRVEFLHYPRIPRQGRCPMAVDISKQQGGRTSGAQPAALSSITAYPALVVTNPWTSKANPKGVKAGVATGAAKSGAKDAWDVRLDSMQSLLERLDKRMDTERADMRQMLETFRRQEVPVGAF